MKNERALLKNTIIIGIGKFSSQILIFLMLPLYTSFLNTTEYGIYDTMIAIVAFITPFTTLLLEESMFRFLIEYENKSDKVKTITITLKLHIIGIIIFTIIYFFICITYSFQYQVLFWLYIVINIINGLSNSLARGLGNIKLFSFSNFLSNVIIVILNVITIAVLKFGIKGLFLSNIIANLISSIFVFIRLNIKQYVGGNIDKIMARRMVTYSIPLVPNSLSWNIINLSDRIMLNYMVSPSANGIYSIANKFPQIMGSIYNFFSTAWKESASKSIGDKEYYNEIYNNIKRYIYIITIVLLVTLPICYNLFVAENFIESYYYVPILIIAMMFSNLSEFYSGIFIAYKNTRIIGYTTVLAAVCNFLINIIFIKRLGIWAASFSTLISTFIVALIRKKQMGKYIKLIENSNESLKYIFLIIISIASFYVKIKIYNILFFILIVIFLCYDNKKYIKKIMQKIRTKLNIIN